MAVPALVGPGRVKVIRTNGCGGNTHEDGSPLQNVIAVSKKLHVTGLARAVTGAANAMAMAANRMSLFTRVHPCVFFCLFLTQANTVYYF
jgi:hypothetical protein